MLQDIPLYEFNSLNNNEKHEAIMEYAVQVGERFDDNYGIMLYQFDNFYVELFFDADGNKIKRFRGFENDELLSPYLEQIDLQELKRR